MGMVAEKKQMEGESKEKKCGEGTLERGRGMEGREAAGEFLHAKINLKLLCWVMRKRIERMNTRLKIRRDSD